MNTVKDTDNYKIYLVNKSSNTQVFWCFLQPPEGLTGSDVFANSSTNLAVAPNYPGINTFTVPVQYVVGAGAQNHAVGLNIKVDSSISSDANLGDIWKAEYVTVPPNQGPNLTKESGSAPQGTLELLSNPFDKVKNENNGWFSNMTFGIQTAQGFIGMTWSPDPNQTRTITPKLQFYVATGTFGENKLASYTDISTTSAAIPLTAFKYLEATVTLEADGTWSVTPGKPVQSLSDNDHIEYLLRSQMDLANAQANLIEMTLQYQAQHKALNPAWDHQKALEQDTVSQQDEVVSVSWDKASKATKDDNFLTFLTGTITVTTALTSAFAFFVLNGIKFSIEGSSRGDTKVKFSYSGRESAENIKNLLKSGVDIVFRQDANLQNVANAKSKATI